MFCISSKFRSGISYCYYLLSSVPFSMRNEWFAGEKLIPDQFTTTGALLTTCPSGLLSASQMPVLPPLRHRFPFQQTLCSFFRQNEANSSLMIFTFIHSWVQHSFSCGYPQLPTRVPSHFTYSQNTNTISLHLFDHLSALTSLKQCPYIPLPDLHTRFWRQQFHLRFMRHSLLRKLLQPGVNILYPCFPVGRSGNSSFGFYKMFLFPGAGYQPAAQPPTRRTRDCSSSALYPSTNPAWLDLPGTKVPVGTALYVGHWDTQAPPPRKGVSPRWRPHIHARLYCDANEKN